METMCYTCTVRPAGNKHAGTFSAYCDECQPYNMRPQLRSTQCRCGACGNTFANLSTFDGHRREGGCMDPISIALELRSGVWGTPEGNSNRDRKAARLASAARGSG